MVAFTLLLSSFSISVFADDVTFTASAPQTVKVGEQFNLILKLKAKGSNFSEPNITDFQVLATPSKLWECIVQRVNDSITYYEIYTFVLMADHEGKFTIPAASVQSDGKTYYSNPITIEVVQQQEESNAPDDTTNPDLKKDDFFVAVSVDKNNLYLGQFLVATIKLYSNTTVYFEELKYPPFTSFWSSVLEAPQQIKQQREVVNGQTYSTGILKKVLLMPLQSGELAIESMENTILAKTHVPSNDPFDKFFGGKTITTQHKITSNSVNITVKPLPAGKPTNFSGGVGNFSLNASVDKTEVKTNDTITLKVEVSGEGNLKFINSIKVDFPRKFNVYDTVTTQNIKTDTNGMSGSVTFDYMFIPRKAGNYRLAPITFSYFDTKSETYKTLTTQEFNIKVEKSSGKSE